MANFTTPSSKSIINQDKDIFRSLSLSPGLDLDVGSNVELSLVWPLSDFSASSKFCSRPVATILRFLHFHALTTKPTVQPSILIDLPPDTREETPEQLFIQVVHNACALLHRSCSENPDTPYDAIVSFFPYANQMHVNSLLKRAQSCNGPLFVLCGDCEVLGMPTSSNDEKERGLDSLRVEMLLKRTFSKSRTSGASIAVEYARGGDDAKFARMENCALRRHQRKQLLGDQELLLLSEKWQVFVASVKEEKSDVRNNDQSDNNEESMKLNVMKMTNKIVSFQRKLISWYNTRLALWEESGGDTLTKLMRKHGTQKSYELYLRNAVVGKWVKQTGLSPSQLWEETTAKTTAKTTTTNASDGPTNYTDFGGFKTEFLEITTDKFINDCLRKDLFPPEASEKVWGIQMGSSSGTNVFAAWKALFFQAVGESGDEQVSKDGVARFRHEVVLAFAHGTLPQFFEKKVRMLENRNYYVDALVKAGFADIPWNTGIHSGFREYAVGRFDPTK